MENSPSLSNYNLIRRESLFPKASEPIVDMPDSSIAARRKTISTFVKIKGKHDKTVLEELFNMQKQQLGEVELRRLYRNVSIDLQELGFEPISEPSKWSQQDESQKIIDLIGTLSRSVKKNRDEVRSKINSIGGELINQSFDFKEEIKRLEKSIILKEQHLSQIKTDISKVQLEIGKDKRNFLLKQKPKLSQIQKIERRIKLLAKQKEHKATM